MAEAERDERRVEYDQERAELYRDELTESKPGAKRDKKRTRGEI